MSRIWTDARWWSPEQDAMPAKSWLCYVLSSGKQVWVWPINGGQFFIRRYPDGEVTVERQRRVLSDKEEK